MLWYSDSVQPTDPSLDSRRLIPEENTVDSYDSSLSSEPLRLMWNPVSSYSGPGYHGVERAIPEIESNGSSLYTDMLTDVFTPPAIDRSSILAETLNYHREEHPEYFPVTDIARLESLPDPWDAVHTSAVDVSIPNSVLGSSTSPSTEGGVRACSLSHSNSTASRREQIGPAYTSKHNLKSHIDYKHLHVEKKIECQYCGKRFTESRAHIRHLKNKNRSIGVDSEDRKMMN
ncbi:hypothetical protein FB446DRAFT_700546 [Lentinula raphanica]|nr:hypothetical protein FB446DRAFT_700546 [Lentinula raphanica]